MTDTLQYQRFTGERALFHSHDVCIEHCTFDDGESPLKESTHLDISHSTFGWKYPLWYDKNVTVKDSVWLRDARAGVWYTTNISLDNCAVNAPKNFRRCSNLTMTHVTIPNAEETLWDCTHVSLTDVSAHGDYFAMNLTDATIEDFQLFGNYGFDGVKNITVRNATLTTKDAFWNSENVTIYDSIISGEYLGWNSKNLTLINCTIESNQGLCYTDGLTLKNCVVRNTDLAFEYCSKIDADITSPVLSIKNPISGSIHAPRIDDIIFDDPDIDRTATTITLES